MQGHTGVNGEDTYKTLRFAFYPVYIGLRKGPERPEILHFCCCQQIPLKTKTNNELPLLTIMSENPES